MSFQVISSTAAKNFGIKRNPLIAILLSIATGGFYFYYWMVRFTLILNKHVKVSQIPLILPFLLLSFLAWGDYHYEMVNNPIQNFLSTDTKIIFMIERLLSVVGFIILIVWSFKAKAAVEEFLLQQGVTHKLNGFLCFLFPICYQYYVLCNIDEIKERQAALAAAAAATATSAAPASSAANDSDQEVV